MTELEAGCEAGLQGMVRVAWAAVEQVRVVRVVRVAWAAVEQVAGVL